MIERSAISLVGFVVWRYNDANIARRGDKEPRLAHAISARDTSKPERLNFQSLTSLNEGV
ncbi:hypothetical protein MASR2M48_16400 [Spirochaetota bacterium]|jgi:hypothetical protein